ncbi:SEC10/PgrA surface exclusion domain-containing protein [Streptococcus hyovaginalis]
MFKNEVKGHGTIKKLRTGAVVSVLALGVAGVGGVVSADEVGASGVTSVAEAPSTDGVVTPVVETVTAEQVATAKVVATEANQAVTAQEGVVASAEQAVTANDASISDLNNQIQEVSAVTPEVVDQAQAEADTAEQNLSTANEAVASAEASLADATNKVESQEGVVASAEAEADKTASAVADAQSKVEGLSTTADTAKLEQSVSDLSAKVETDTTNVENAKSALEAAKLAETNRPQAIEDQKAVVASAEGNVDSTAKAYSDAIVAQQGTQSVEDSAKTALDTLQTNSGSSIFVPSWYNDTIRQLTKAYGNVFSGVDVTTNQAKIAELEKKISDWADSTYFLEDTIFAGREGYRYEGDTKDYDRIVDVNNLSYEESLELSLFAQNLINDVRRQLGSPLLRVSSTSVDVARRNAKLDKITTIGHDLDALAQVAKEFGVSEVNESGGYSYGSSTPSMYLLKDNIFKELVGMLYRDSDSLWGHTLHITNLYGGQEEYFGVGNHLSPVGMLKTHYNTVEVKNTEGLSSFDKTDLGSSDDLDKAQSAYNLAVQSNKDAKAKVASTQTSYETAQTKLAEAQKALSDLQSGTTDIPALEQAVKDAETQLEIDQASLQTAKETLALAKASAVDKAKALEDAKTELAEAIKANESAQGVLTQENETLEVLRKAVEVAELALAEAEGAQAVAQTTFDTASAKASDLATKLANKDSILAELNSQLAEATSKSETLRAELETAKELLETLKADANAKNVEYLRLLGLKAEQDKAEAEVGTNQVANIKNVSSQTNQSVHNKAITAKITQNIVSRHQAGKTSYQASLPETGDESSLFTIMGVSLLLGLGFVGKRRKV